MSGRLFVAIFLGIVAATVGAAVGLVWLAGSGTFGRHEAPGVVSEVPRPPEAVARASRAIARAADEIGVPRPKQVLFGDLHVHTTFSTDAFLLSLPGMMGEGAHPPADACDFARHCAALDFWSINDHAEGMTRRHWRETIDSIRQCEAAAGEPQNPDLVSFVGWEWSQVGSSPDDHYGHKNVVLADLEGDRLPARPIASAAPEGGGLPGPLARGLLGFRSRNSRFHDFAGFLAERAELEACPEGAPPPDSVDCIDVAATPELLFQKLRASGLPSLVIPHGTTWGFNTPPGTTWDKQLEGGFHDPERQRLLEVYSGHGDGDVYRDWRAVELDENGEASCPEPREEYLPSCWRAGEIIEERCLESGEGPEECEERARVARLEAAAAGRLAHHTVSGEDAAEWRDAGQCRDCDQPSFNYRPGGSAQYLLALGSFDEPGVPPRRIRPGFIGSSDSHTARAGSGYKELRRAGMTDSFTPDGASGSQAFLRPDTDEAVAFSKPIDPGGRPSLGLLEWERQASFFQTGGLVAVHAEGRDRSAIWQALQRREVYATTGPRILLWFDLLNAPGGPGRSVAMGGEVSMEANPIFQVRAVGSFEQQPGCPEATGQALGPHRLERLCLGECHHPGETRRLITRIEVVRIRPQVDPSEDPADLIDDPWRSFDCEPDPAGCSVSFEDRGFRNGGREAVYYARAFEAPRLAINAGGVRCTYDEAGRCVEVDLCGSGGGRDDCLDDHEPRAWSSPLFIEFSGARPASAVGGLAGR
ncbi:MAG: hypothetical protein CL910_21360 [Deltaproteobacteria bacterium]|nr:hypothetical protein [Deltaproteobacteria bacterium]